MRSGSRLRVNAKVEITYNRDVITKPAKTVSGLPDPGAGQLALETISHDRGTAISAPEVGPQTVRRMSLMPICISFPANHKPGIAKKKNDPEYAMATAPGPDKIATANNRQVTKSTMVLQAKYLSARPDEKWSHPTVPWINMGPIPGPK